jgi:hypothetical protein
MSLKRKNRNGLTGGRIPGAKDPRRTRAILEMPDVPTNAHQTLQLDQENDADSNGEKPFLVGRPESHLRGKII